jgi:hypothetical protein
MEKKERLRGKEVLVTEYRYTPEYYQSATRGIYCLQFITFKNDKKGMIVLDWWRKASIDLCYARFEDNKFGDQKYFDDWTTRFEGIHVLQHLAGEVAPWNIQQYNINNLVFN